LEVYQTELLLAHVVSHVLGLVTFETVEPRLFLLLSHDPLAPNKFTCALLSKVVPDSRIQGLELAPILLAQIDVTSKGGQEI
jgi:hypothetical protein